MKMIFPSRKVARTCSNAVIPFLSSRFRIDDVVHASAVHFGCGMWGLVGAGLFTTQERYADVYSYGALADPSRIDTCCGGEPC